MELGPSLIRAGSWALAAELLRWIPELRLTETHPGGGQYDCLSLRSAADEARPGSSGLAIDINRGGSLHVLESPGGEAIPLVDGDSLARAYANRSIHDVALRVLDHCRVKKSSRPGPTVPHVLAARAIASVMASKVFDNHDWDARNVILDSSGMDGGEVLYPTPFPEIADRYQPETWALLRDGIPVGWVWDGWFWSQRGERIDLMALRDRGSSIEHLAATISAKPTARHATTLGFADDPSPH